MPRKDLSKKDITVASSASPETSGSSASTSDSHGKVKSTKTNSSSSKKHKVELENETSRTSSLTGFANLQIHMGQLLFNTISLAVLLAAMYMATSDAALLSADPGAYSNSILQSDKRAAPSRHKMNRHAKSRTTSFASAPEMAMASMSMPEGPEVGSRTVDSYESVSSMENPSSRPLESPRMLVRTGNINIQADRDRLHNMSEQIKDYTEKIHGYTESSQANTGYKDHRTSRMAGASITMQIKVPAADFRTSMQFLRGLSGKNGALDILSESESVRDVTEQFVDEKARAESLEGTHKALLKLLDDAKNVKDILQIQRELRRVVQELESRKATVKSLKNRADYSQISVHLQQRPLSPILIPDSGDGWAKWDPLRTVRLVLRWLHKMAVVVGDTAIIFAITIIPFSLIFGILYFGLRHQCSSCFIVKQMRQPRDTEFA